MECALLAPMAGRKVLTSSMMPTSTHKQAGRAAVSSLLLTPNAREEDTATVQAVHAQFRAGLQQQSEGVRSGGGLNCFKLMCSKSTCARNNHPSHRMFVSNNSSVSQYTGLTSEWLTLSQNLAKLGGGILRCFGLGVFFFAWSLSRLVTFVGLARKSQLG